MSKTRAELLRLLALGPLPPLDILQNLADCLMAWFPCDGKISINSEDNFSKRYQHILAAVRVLDDQWHLVLGVSWR